MQRLDPFLATRGIAADLRRPGREYVYRLGEVLVGDDDEASVQSSLRQAGCSRDPGDVDRPAPGLEAGWVARELAQLLPPGLNVVPTGGRRPAASQPDVEADERLRDECGWTRWYVPPQLDVPAIVGGLERDAGGRRRRMRPNHVLSFEPIWRGGPATAPAPHARLPEPGPCDGDVTVVVLDTGIVADWEADPWFRDRVTAGEHDHERLDVDGDGVLDLQAGHGTFIAGILAAQAPRARVVVRRVLDSFGLTDEAALAVAVRAVCDDVGDGILNLSLGGYTLDDEPSPVLERALRQLSPHAAVVAAAGNAAQARPFFPAAMKGVIAVGATDGGDPVDGAWSFTNRGGWVDCSAHGADVRSRFVTHDGPQRGKADPDDFHGYAVWSGTSFAAPLVAARIATRAMDDGRTPAQAARELLRDHTLPELPGLGVVIA